MEADDRVEFAKEVELQKSLVELKGTLAMVHRVDGAWRQSQTNVWFLVDSEKGIWVKQASSRARLGVADASRQ